MAKTTYRTVELKDGSWAVETTRPGAAPMTTSGFATEAEAEAWAERKRRAALDVNQRAKSIVDHVTRDD